MEASNFSTVNTSLTEKDMLDMLSQDAVIIPAPVQASLPTTETEVSDISSEVSQNECLTSKNAVKFLLDGTLKTKVCRYCLNVTSTLSELDQILQVAGQGILYKVTIREMIASFHPFKVVHDPNFPNKICDRCLDRTLSSYLFTQQCERSERALRNCFEDIFEKLEKLDPLERQKKRGRAKLNPNHNVIAVAHAKVMDYAEPIMTIINTSSESSSESNVSDNLICPKCCQKMPNLQSLFNHEKSHPTSMWYNCHLCGKSFPKRNQLRKHMQSSHATGKPIGSNKTDFTCQECGTVSVDYHTHLQHIEKHKFKEALDHLITRKMDKLCAVCLNKGSKLHEMEQMVCLHGGYPEMMGERSLYNILGSTVPEMNILHNYTGTKICEKCLNHAIIAYVFIQQTLYVRNRLNTCISNMLGRLNEIDNAGGNLFVEISQHLIMPMKDEELDEDLFVDECEEIDESKLKVDVLEDEFREKSETESSEDENSEERETVKIKLESNGRINNDNKDVTFDKRNIKTEASIIFNGVYSEKRTKYNSVDVCSEFLTFKKRRKPVKRLYKYKITCPLCNKHFISNYFLKRHVLKHVLRKCECKLCGLTFNSKFYLFEHMKIRHIMKKKTSVSCKICGRTFTDERNLITHQKCHETKQCQLCCKTYKSQNHYNTHMQRHFNQLRTLRQKGVQNCSFCEKECASDNDLSVHVNKIHLQIKPYSCDMCDKQFYTESNMSNHKKVHSILCKETCEFCNKTLKCRAALVTHVRKHIGVRPNTCIICNQEFYSLSKLENHMKMSHGGRYCCKLCKKVFSNKTGLKDHIDRAHSII